MHVPPSDVTCGKRADAKMRFPSAPEVVTTMSTSVPLFEYVGIGLAGEGIADSLGVGIGAEDRGELVTEGVVVDPDTVGLAVHPLRIAVSASTAAPRPTSRILSTSTDYVAGPICAAKRNGVPSADVNGGSCRVSHSQPEACPAHEP